MFTMLWYCVKPNFEGLLLSNIVYNAPTNALFSILQNIHGNNIASGYSNETYVPIHIVSRHWRKYL